MKKILFSTFILGLLFILIPTLTLAASLSVPKNLEVPVKHRHAKTVKLTWDKVSKAKYYKVKVAVWSGKKLKVFKNVRKTSKWVPKRYLKANKRYWFKAKACNKSGCGKYSDWCEFRTDPPKVKNLKVTYMTENSVNLWWDSVRGQNEYFEINLFYPDNNVSLKKYTTEMDENYYVINNIDEVTSRHRLKVRVRAIYNWLNEGKYSKGVIFTLPFDPAEG